MTHTRQHLDQLRYQITNHKGIIARDLLKFWRNAEEVWIELDREYVQCRRLNRLTTRYETLATEYQNRIERLEKRLTWANLLA